MLVSILINNLTNILVVGLYSPISEPVLFYADVAETIPFYVDTDETIQFEA